MRITLRGEVPQARLVRRVTFHVKSPTHNDSGQDILKQATVHVERFLKRSAKTRRQVEKAVRTTAQQALIKGAGTIRRQADDLQAGLKKLSGRLARLERGRKATSATRGSRQATARKRPVARARTRRPARQKKAA